MRALNPSRWASLALDPTYTDPVGWVEAAPSPKSNASGQTSYLLFIVEGVIAATAV